MVGEAREIHRGKGKQRPRARQAESEAARTSNSRSRTPTTSRGTPSTGVATTLRSPPNRRRQKVTEDHDLASPRAILFGKERPSVARAPTEQAKEIRADHRNGQRLESRAAGQVPGAEAVAGEVPNPGGLPLKQIEDGRGHLRPAASRGSVRPRQ